MIQILCHQTPNLDLKLINSGAAGGGLLRSGRCFYDPSTKAPTTLAAYAARPHAKVVFSDDETSQVDEVLHGLGYKRRIALRVDSFSALPGMMKGSDLIIAQHKIIGRSFLRDFSNCAMAIEMERLPFFMSWHQSKNQTPMQIWLRTQIWGVVKALKQESAITG